MNKETLKKLGIEDEELIQKIIVEHGKDIEKHKTDLASSNTELEGLKTQLTEANTAIEGFRKLDPEALQKAVDEWKTKAETTAQEAQAQIQTLKFDHALESALIAAKAKKTKEVRAHLNTELLKLSDDGSISGLKEQLEKIQAESDYLFENETPVPKVVAGGKSKSVMGDAMVEAARRAAGLTVEE